MVYFDLDFIFFLDIRFMIYIWKILNLGIVCFRWGIEGYFLLRLIVFVFDYSLFFDQFVFLFLHYLLGRLGIKKLFIGEKLDLLMFIKKIDKIKKKCKFGLGCSLVIVFLFGLWV